MREGTILGGRYEIQSKIGSGGMSDVYKAHDTVLNRMVAVKVLKPEFSADKNFVAKFRREAQAAAGLSHPNVVNVYDVNEDGELHYIVMELIEGITLKRYIERKGKMKMREAVEVAMQIAKGLEAAHAQGIIHRDIKPQNIMISREGKIKVTDFGIARITTAQTTSTDTMGSVHYISPEQARGGYCDERSDIYSLGITLYEMLTGVVPFNGETSVAVALQHIQGEMTPLSEVDPEIPEGLDRIVQKCTQKKPEFRYATMTALLEDLRRFIADPEGLLVKLPGDPKAETEGEAAQTPAGEEEEKAAVIPPAASRRKSPVDAEAEVEEAVAERKARRTENILTYTMIGVALIILIVIIAILLRACGTLLPVESSRYSSSPSHSQQPTVRPTPGESTAPAESSTEPLTEPSTEPSEPFTETQPSSETEPGSPEESSDESKTTMPYVVGMSYADAVELLDSLGLTTLPELVSAPPGSSYSIMDVCAQEVPEGTELEKGSVVTLSVVGSSNAVIIPQSIMGANTTDAKAALIQLGLRVVDDYTWTNNEFVSYGKVVDTYPSLGSVVDKGTSVQLILSLGSAPKLTVPDITGDTEKEALEKLKTAGLKPGNVTYEYHNTVLKDRIISQSPEGNDQVSADTKIDFVLSLGRPTMPDVVGKTPEDAEKLLKEFGLLAGEKIETFSSKIAEGRVVSAQTQSGVAVKAGDSVKVGDTINLLVSKGPESTVMPEEIDGKPLIDGNALAAKEYFEDPMNGGFKVVWKNKKEPKEDDLVVRTEPAPGEELLYGSEIVITYGTPVEVPDVFDMTVEEAVTYLTDRGFEVEFPDGEPTGDALIKTISPEAGTVVGYGRSVELTYETAVEVPEVIGMTVEQAQIALYQAGLIPKLEEGKTPEAGASVTGTNPPAGTLVKNLSEVTIFFENPPEPPTLYTITWRVNGTDITEEYEEGQMPSFKGSTDRPGDAQYTYTFTGWSPEIASVTGNATYTAQYAQTRNTYTVTWVVNGSTTTESYEYGLTPSFKGSTDRPGDAQYTYTFTGWSPVIASVTGNATYTAQYAQTVNTYTVTWIVDGNVTTETYEYGQMPSFGGSVDKASDGEFSYRFTGWSPSVVTVTGDAVYTAQYEATPLPTAETTALPPANDPSEAESGTDGTEP